MTLEKRTFSNLTVSDLSWSFCDKGLSQGWKGQSRIRSMNSREEVPGLRVCLRW